MAKWVYKFEEGSAAMRNLLGGKGCNLAEMTNLGMPIPQGFTVTTEACTDYYNSGKQITKEIQDQIFEALTWLEGVNGKKFGDTEDPLLVSVRSGARASMPGMMDTILNLGLNDVAVEGFAKKTGNPRFAYDSYRRFIQMYSDVVMEVPKSYFEKIIDEMKEAKGVHYDTELDANDLKELAEKFKAVYKEAMNGEEFPQDPKEQLMGAVKAVFRSWDNPRANVYRRDNDIPYSWGTAVNVQMMAFGNMGDDCGTGVAFTRDPATGENLSLIHICMKERPGKGRLVDIDATIICERDSHKGIIIGKQGSMLKKIGSNARFELERMLDAKVNLKLWVKVKKDWRDSDFLIKNFGYDKKEI